jgi:hypothetical protein
MNDNHDLNRIDFQPFDEFATRCCDTCGKHLAVVGTAGHLDIYRPKELVAKFGSHAETDFLALSKNRLFAAKITTRENVLLNSGSLVATSSIVVHFCSRLCRNVYKARLYMGVYPHYYPYHEPSKHVMHRPGWENIYNPSPMTDHVDFDKKGNEDEKP